MPPCVGDRIPARQDKRVVLPHPLGPRSSTSSPSPTSRSRCSIGRTTYPLCEYSMVRSVMVTDAMSAREGEGGVDVHRPTQARETRQQSDSDSHNGQSDVRGAGDVQGDREERLQEV